MRAHDGRVYGTVDAPLLVTVTEVNEASVITTTSRTEFTIRENSTSTVYTNRATYQDQNDVIRWSVEETDGGDFVIDRYSGVLSFRNTPDYGRPADSDLNNVYELTVRATTAGPTVA